MNKIIIGLILGIIITFSLIEIRKRCFIKGSATQLLHKNIQVLVRQAARWAVAAEQDTSPLIAVLHSNYSAGYLWALLDIANKEQIKSATNIDIDEFRKKIVNIKDKNTINYQNYVRVCPKNNYLTKIAKES